MDGRRKKPGWVFWTTVVLAFVLVGAYVAGIGPAVTPVVVRLPFPASQELSEEDGITLSKEALMMAGKGSPAMHPVPTGHKNQRGNDIIYYRSRTRPNEGFVLWRVQCNDCEWDYSVGLLRNGAEVECTLSIPK